MRCTQEQQQYKPYKEGCSHGFHSERCPRSDPWSARVRMWLSSGQSAPQEMSAESNYWDQDALSLAQSKLTIVGK